MSRLNKRIGLDSKLTLSESTFEPLLVVQPEFWVILRQEVGREGANPPLGHTLPNSSLIHSLINIARD